jgi:hypothetical protein
MSIKTFTEDFKIEAVTQITEQGYPVFTYLHHRMRCIALRDPPDFLILQSNIHIKICNHSDIFSAEAVSIFCNTGNYLIGGL